MFASFYSSSPSQPGRTHLQSRSPNRIFCSCAGPPFFFAFVFIESLLLKEFSSLKEAFATTTQTDFRGQFRDRPVIKVVGDVNECILIVIVFWIKWKNETLLSVKCCCVRYVLKKENSEDAKAQHQYCSLLKTTLLSFKSFSEKSLSLLFCCVCASSARVKKCSTLTSLQTGRTTKKFGVRLTY